MKNLAFALTLGALTSTLISCGGKSPSAPSDTPEAPAPEASAAPGSRSNRPANASVEAVKTAGRAEGKVLRLDFPDLAYPGEPSEALPLIARTAEEADRDSSSKDPAKTVRQRAGYTCKLLGFSRADHEKTKTEPFEGAGVVVDEVRQNHVPFMTFGTRWIYPMGKFSAERFTELVCVGALPGRKQVPDVQHVEDLVFGNTQLRPLDPVTKDGLPYLATLTQTPEEAHDRIQQARAGRRFQDLDAKAERICKKSKFRGFAYYKTRMLDEPGSVRVAVLSQDDPGVKALELGEPDPSLPRTIFSELLCYL
jgi:hypothetical protein